MLQLYFVYNNNYKIKRKEEKLEDYQKKIKEKLNVVPLEPGCYLMKDRNDQVIYVGKAKIKKSPTFLLYWCT